MHASNNTTNRQYMIKPNIINICDTTFINLDYVEYVDVYRSEQVECTIKFVSGRTLHFEDYLATQVLLALRGMTNE